MQSENTRTATIIGGSYIEACDLYDGKLQLKGSEIRALEVFLELGWNGTDYCRSTMSWNWIKSWMKQIRVANLYCQRRL